MPYDFSGSDAIIRAALGRVFPAAQVVVRRDGAAVWSAAYGWLDPEAQARPATADTLFDLASVTKLFVVAAFMTLVEAGRAGLDQPVAVVLPEFTGARPIQAYDDPLKPGATVAVAWAAGSAPATHVDAARVTFRHLLTHTSGLPAWRPLYKAESHHVPGACEVPGTSAAAARQAALATYFSYPTGTRIIYSDLGLILLGMAVERLTGQSLDAAVAQRVTGPLGLTATRYLQISKSANGRNGGPRCQQIGGFANANTYHAPRNIAPTEFCAWRNRRIVGEVHDENAAGLDGVAGHAGLFSTASELAVFGETFLVNRQISKLANQRVAPGVSSVLPSAFCLLHSETLAEMTRIQAQDGATRRGIGFALWSPDGEASSNPFSERAFGHTGFTGTSLWMDPERDLTVAVCTNRVYYGRDAGGILAFRVALHRAIVEAL
jgi:CubicO group peptidase (beta-lactamase class C family)